MTAEQAVTVDAEVYSSDDVRLGRVKAVADGYLKVDASMQFDYWLPLGLVASATRQRVTMQFAKHDLDEHKAELPGDRASDRSRDDISMRGRLGPDTQSELYRTDDRELSAPDQTVRPRTDSLPERQQGGDISGGRPSSG